MIVTRTLITAVAFLLWRQRAVYACIHPDLANCTTVYTQSLEGSVITSKDQYCRVLRSYYTCVGGICGTLPEDMIDFIVDAQTHYFDCGISSSPVATSMSLPLLLMTVLLPGLKIM
ncbi:hypothetical protein V1264_011835 [Littorina saxatilis]|uniref:Uncharacterized protein n=1 Tax=Littorina saxatilis TaxID=31220 RepID=A0AAN9GLC6_9CAEN